MSLRLEKVKEINVFSGPFFLLHSEVILSYMRNNIYGNNLKVS